MAFAIETGTTTPSGLPVYLKLTDPSGKFDAKIYKNNKCENSTDYRNIQGLQFLGCADNSTKFILLFKNNKNEYINIAANSPAAKGFTFPAEGHEQPEMSMNRFCGRIITDTYNVLMSITKGPENIDGWVINLKIEQKNK